jgi:SHS2 domain-containing protein
MASMKKPYRYLDHTADLGIEVWGANIAEMFANVGRAIFETQVSGKLKSNKEKSIVLQCESLEDLFIDWCRELLYNFSVNSFIPSDYQICIEGYSLRAQMRGDLYDPKRHRIRIEIKNPTYHGLKVKKNEEGFRARIIFDV